MAGKSRLGFGTDTGTESLGALRIMEIGLRGMKASERVNSLIRKLAFGIIVGAQLNSARNSHLTLYATLMSAMLHASEVR